MGPQCDICFLDFDLDCHRPKVLPCGHTVCKACVENPGLGTKCPTCRKDLAPDPDDLIDNIYLIQMMENDGAPPCKRCKTAETRVQQLQRGADAGRQVVQQLRQVLPLAVEALQRQLDASAAQLRQMEEALQQQDLSQEQLQVAARLEHSLRVLTTECSVVASRDGAACSTPVRLGGVGDIVRAVLLQLQAEKVDDDPATVSVSPSAYVGPPMTTIFTVRDDNLANDRLKVNEILRDGPRWRNIRCLKKLRGHGLRKLLPLLASQLEELEFATYEFQTPKVFEELAKMNSLKRLSVACDEDEDNYPDLPLQLEELVIGWPSEQQLRCVLRMPNLRSLRVTDYGGENVAFPPAQSGGLLWLGTGFSIENKPTMLSLIRAHATSLKELEVYCTVSAKDYDSYYFPELGRDLAACGVEHLQRLVLERPTSNRCKDVAGCLLQRQAIRGFLPRVDVVCDSCNASVL